MSITPAKTNEYVERLVETTGATAVFVAGNGQRAIGAIGHVESELGITLLTANQVLVWECLDGTAVRDQIQGYGRLFSSS